MAERIKRVIYREVRKGRPVYPFKAEAAGREQAGDGKMESRAEQQACSRQVLGTPHRVTGTGGESKAVGE